MSQDYHGPERRDSRILTEDRVVNLINTSLESHGGRMIEHFDKKLAELTETFKSAFPNGDPHGHRAAHEANIKQAEGWSKLKNEMINKMLTGGIWVVVVWLTVTVAHSFKEWVMK